MSVKCQFSVASQRLEIKVIINEMQAYKKSPGIKIEKEAGKERDGD